MDLVSCLKEHKFGVSEVCEALLDFSKAVAPKASFGVAQHGCLSAPAPCQGCSPELSVCQDSPVLWCSPSAALPGYLLGMLQVQAPVGKVW